jgi:hypothetical protein
MDPNLERDWRLGGNEKLFRGAVFVRKKYAPWTPEWEHDHCSFCRAEFVEEGAPVHEARTFHEGYTTPGPPREPREDYYWVCPPCFEDFRERLGLTLRQAAGDGDTP